MSSHSDEYRRKADELLSLATAEADMKRRSQLIDEAAHWHHKALDAAGHSSAEIDGQPMPRSRSSRGS